MNQRISAVFDAREQAQNALSTLRRHGIHDEQLYVMSARPQNNNRASSEVTCQILTGENLDFLVSPKPLSHEYQNERHPRREFLPSDPAELINLGYSPEEALHLEGLVLGGKVVVAIEDGDNVSVEDTRYILKSCGGRSRWIYR